MWPRAQGVDLEASLGHDLCQQAIAGLGSDNAACAAAWCPSGGIHLAER